MWNQNTAEKIQFCSFQRQIVRAPKENKSENLLIKWRSQRGVQFEVEPRNLIEKKCVIIITKRKFGLVVFVCDFIWFTLKLCALPCSLWPKQKDREKHVCYSRALWRCYYCQATWWLLITCIAFARCRQFFFFSSYRASFCCFFFLFVNIFLKSNGTGGCVCILAKQIKKIDTHAHAGAEKRFR